MTWFGIESLKRSSKASAITMTTHEESYERAFVDMVAFLQATWREEGKEIWVGYPTKNPPPFVLTFDSGQLYAFNFMAPSPLWSPLTLHGEELLFSATDHWNLQSIQLENDLLVDGERALVFHCDLTKDNLTSLLVALLHEQFHNHQLATFLHPQLSVSGYLDHFHHENIGWMLVEEMILADFIHGQLDEERSLFHKAAPLNDLLAVHRLRRQLLQEDSLAWEYQQQRLEGIADYVALKSMERVPSSSFKSLEYLLSSLEAFSINEEILERTTKGRHYPVGAALAYALDFLKVPDWQRKVESEGLSPVEILAEVIELSDEEAALRLEKIKNRYAFDKILLQVSTALHAYQEEIDDLVDEYKRMEGIELVVGRPKGFYSKREGVCSLYNYYLTDGSLLSLADTSTHQLPEEGWSLSTFGAPLLISNRDGTLTLKVEEELEITVDGKLYNLSDLQSSGGGLFFTSLRLCSRHCELLSRATTGVLKLQGRQLTISYPENYKGK